MELKIIKEEQNPLFNRKEIVATTPKINSSPKKQEIIQTLSEKYSIPTDALRILDIKGKFGTNDFTIRANLYPSNEERNNYERLTKKEIESEKKLLEKPAEEKAPETQPEVLEKSEPEEKEVPETTEKPVVEVKEMPTPEEDKKEKDKSKEEKLNETELQA